MKIEYKYKYKAKQVFYQWVEQKIENKYSGIFVKKKKSNMWVLLPLTCHIKEHTLFLFVGGCHKTKI